MFHKRSMLLKLLIPYFVALLLPILTIWFYLFPELQQKITNNALIQQENAVARLDAMLDQHISSMILSTSVFSSNSQLTPYAISSDHMGNYKAVAELKKYIVGNSFISQSFYYLKSNNRLYTSSASYPLEWLSNTNYGYCYYDWLPDDLYRDLQALDSTTVRPLERVLYPDHLEGNVVTLMFPIPMNSKTPYAVLMVWVDQSSFETLISPVQQHVNECTLIYDRTGTRVFSMYNEQLGLSDDELDNVIQRAERENKRWITLGGREYALASSARGSNSWRCVSLLPLDSFWDDIVVIRRNLVLINLLLIAATMFVITVTVRRYYQPIRNLANRTEQFVGNQSGNNELEMIHHALDHLNTKAAMMQSKYMDSIPVLKEHVLYALVSGQYETISAFNEAAADVPLHFTQPYLSVALIHPDMKETVDVLDYLEGLASDLPRGLEGYYLSAFSNKDIIFVSAGHSPDAAGVYIQDICDDISATHHCKVQAAVGQSVSSAAELSLSYTNAYEQLEKMQLMGKYGVLCCSGDARALNATNLSKLSPIEFAVAKMDTEQIRAGVAEVLAFFRAEESSSVMIQAVYLNALASLGRGLERLGLDAEPYLTNFELLHSKKYEEMARNLSVLVDTLCDCIDKGKTESEVDIEDVKAYIAEKCLSGDFTVECVADAFHMSYTGFSHYFKRKTGISCKRFVDEYRAKTAIELITTTMEPLEEIAHRVGFLTATSFIRSFKKVTGQTPGTYRNLQ